MDPKSHVFTVQISLSTDEQSASEVQKVPPTGGVVVGSILRDGAGVGGVVLGSELTVGATVGGGPIGDASQMNGLASHWKLSREQTLSAHGRRSPSHSITNIGQSRVQGKSAFGLLLTLFRVLLCFWRDFDLLVAIVCRAQHRRANKRDGPLLPSFHLECYPTVPA